MKVAKSFVWNTVNQSKEIALWMESVCPLCFEGQWSIAWAASVPRLLTLRETSFSFDLTLNTCRAFIHCQGSDNHHKVILWERLNIWPGITKWDSEGKAEKLVAGVWITKITYAESPQWEFSFAPCCIPKDHERRKRHWGRREGLGWCSQVQLAAVCLGLAVLLWSQTRGLWLVCVLFCLCSAVAQCNEDTRSLVHLWMGHFTL